MYNRMTARRRESDDFYRPPVAATKDVQRPLISPKSDAETRARLSSSLRIKAIETKIYNEFHESSGRITFDPKTS
jgi:hypothetical protein